MMVGELSDRALSFKSLLKFSVIHFSIFVSFSLEFFLLIQYFKIDNSSTPDSLGLKFNSISL